MYCLLTRGEAARVVGVDTVEFLGLPDGVLEYGVRTVWVGGSPDTRHAVDITDTFEFGVESLKAHRKYLDCLGWEKFDAAESLQGLARQTRTRLGVPMAVGLEVHDRGRG